MANTTITASLKLFDNFSNQLNTINSSLNRSRSGIERFKSSVESSVNGSSLNKFNSALTNTSNKARSAFNGVGSKIKSELSQGGGGFNNLNNQARNTSNLFKTMFGAQILGNAVTSVISRLTSEIGSMASDIDNASAAWASFGTNMQIAGYSSKQITAMSGGLKQYANATIYSSADMAKTVGVMATSGVKGADNLVKAFGNMASASDDPTQAMKSMSQQMSQVNGKGFVQTMDFRIMQEQAAGPMKMVQQELMKINHWSPAQFQKALSSGKISADELNKAMLDVGNSSSKSSRMLQRMATTPHTIGQAFDSLKETISNTMADTSAFKTFQKGFIKLTGTIADNAPKAIDGFIKGFGSQMGPALSKLKPLADGFKSLLQNLGGGKDVASMANGFGKLAAKAIIVAPALMGIVAAFRLLKSVSNIKNIFSSLGGGKVTNPVAPLASSIQSFKQLVGGGISFTIKAIGVAAVIASLALLAKSLQGIATAGAQAPANLLTFGAVVGGLAVVFSVFGSMLQTSAIGILAFGASISMMALSMAMIAQTGTSGAIAMASFAVSVSLMAGVLALLGPALMVAAPGMIAFGAAVLMVGAGIAVASLGITLLATQLPIIATFGLSAALGITALGAAAIVFGAGTIVAGVGASVLGISLGILAVGALAGSVALIALGAGATIAGAGMLVLGASLVVVGAGLRTAAAGARVMYSTFVSIFRSVVSAVTSAMRSVVSAVSSGIRAAVAAVRSVGGSLVSAGRNFVMGFVNGIKGAIGAAASAAASMAKSAVSAAKKFLNIHSPSRVMRDQVGKYFALGMAVGIDKNGKAVNNASSNLADNAVTAASGMELPAISGAQIGDYQVPNAPKMADLNASSTVTTNQQTKLGTSFNQQLIPSIATGFNAATQAVLRFVGSLNGIKTPELALATSNGTSTDATSVLGASKSSAPVATNNHDVSVNIQPGAIVIQGTSESYDAETLLEKIEDKIIEHAQKNLKR